MLENLYGGNFLDLRCLIVLHMTLIQWDSLENIIKLPYFRVEIDDFSNESCHKTLQRVFLQRTNVDAILQEFLNAVSFWIFERSFFCTVFARKYSLKHCSDKNPCLFEKTFVQKVYHTLQTLNFSDSMEIGYIEKAANLS